MIDDLNTAIHILAHYQREQKLAQKVYDSIKKEIMDQLKPFEDMMKQANEKVTKMEEEIKESILHKLIEDGEITSLPGVHITHQKKKVYDDRDAVCWAMKMGFDEMLSIQKSVLNKVIDEINYIPEFMEIRLVPVVAVSKDLTSMLEKAKNPQKTTAEMMLPEKLK